MPLLKREFPLLFFKKWEFKWKLKWEFKVGIVDKYGLILQAPKLSMKFSLEHCSLIFRSCAHDAIVDIHHIGQCLTSGFQDSTWVIHLQGFEIKGTIVP